MVRTTGTIGANGDRIARGATSQQLEASGENLAALEQDLVARPKETLERCYRELGIEMSERFRDRLRFEDKKQSAYRSKHSYSLEDFGLSREAVYEQLVDVFEEYGFDPEYGDGRASA